MACSYERNDNGNIICPKCGYIIKDNLVVKCPRCAKLLIKKCSECDGCSLRK